MDFIDQLKQFSKRVESMKDSIQTEEATKTAIIMPFLNLTPSLFRSGPSSAHLRHGILPILQLF